jgi:hypothetical protein
MRWSTSGLSPARLGDIAWAFENIDRLGRFYCFHCGASQLKRNGDPARRRLSWQAKCLTLPELIKTMSGQGTETPGYDEVKVFEVEAADPETALQVAQRVASEGVSPHIDPLEEAREILTRYGAHGVPNSRPYSAPFLWYNILPGRSVAVRKLPLHLLQLRAAGERRAPASMEQVEDQARGVAGRIAGVLGLGECLVARVRSEFILGLQVGVDATLSVAQGHAIAQRVEEGVREANPKVRSVLARVYPHDESASD